MFSDGQPTYNHDVDKSSLTLLHIENHNLTNQLSVNVSKKGSKDKMIKSRVSPEIIAIESDCTRERERERERDRQTERETERERDRETHEHKMNTEILSIPCKDW